MTIQQAIQQSQSTTTPVTITINAPDIFAVLGEINALYEGDADYSATTEPGQYDVWGCTEERPDDMDFRLTVILA